RVFPARRDWIPSPAGVGLAWTFHWYYGVLFFVGGLLGWGLGKTRPQLSQEIPFPRGSGWGARERLMGVALGVWGEGPAVVARLSGGGGVGRGGGGWGFPADEPIDRRLSRCILDVRRAEREPSARSRSRALEVTPRADQLTCGSSSGREVDKTGRERCPGVGGSGGQRADVGQAGSQSRVSVRTAGGHGDDRGPCCSRGPVRCGRCLRDRRRACRSRPLSRARDLRESCESDRPMRGEAGASRTDRGRCL